MEHNIHYICRVGRLYSDSVFTCQQWLPVVVEKNKIRKAVSEFSGIWNCINRNHSNKFSFNRTDVMDADDTGNVVFPAPFAPSNPQTPGVNVMETLSTAVLSLYFFVMFSTSNFMRFIPPFDSRKVHSYFLKSVIL